eukprot:s887_g16.t1
MAVSVIPLIDNVLHQSATILILWILTEPVHHIFSHPTRECPRVQNNMEPHFLSIGTSSRGTLCDSKIRREPLRELRTSVPKDGSCALSASEALLNSLEQWKNLVIYLDVAAVQDLTFFWVCVLQFFILSLDVWFECRLEARRLHHLLGAPSAERSSLAAKSIPAFVVSSLPLTHAETLGRLVGHRSAAGESLLTSVLADHDRSQHAERQALLSLVEGLDPAVPAGQNLTGENPSGAIHLYISAHPCISCTAVFFQLTHLWPGVCLRLAFDAWEETRRWTVHREIPPLRILSEDEFW